VLVIAVVLFAAERHVLFLLCFAGSVFVKAQIWPNIGECDHHLVPLVTVLCDFVGVTFLP
jgi:cation transporter-like permease